VRKRLIVSIVLLIGIALAIYLAVTRDRGPRPLKLALVTWTEDSFWEPLVHGAQEYANRSNVALTVIRSKPTAEAQTQHVRALLDSGIDGLAISPNDAVAQKAILDEAAGRVPVVTFDTDAPDSKRRRFVSIDNYAAGRVAAGQIREALPDGGAVLISVGSVTMQHGRDRRQGVIDALLDRPVDRDRPADPIDAPLKGPKYTIVATATDGGDPAKAVDSIAAALKAHPEVKGVVGLFSYSAPAAIEAMKQAGRTDKVQVVGFDESDETQAALEAGTIHSSVVQESYRAGNETIRVLTEAIRGDASKGQGDAPPTLVVGVSVLTAEDLGYMRNLGLIRKPAGSTATKPAQ
jgi:ribose transport system substrate-binding protein